MSYKLYDFDKEVVPEELDEQIRLICDLLYNKRETYPNQSSGKGFGGGLAPIPFWKRHNSVVWQRVRPGSNIQGTPASAINCGVTISGGGAIGVQKDFDSLATGFISTTTTLDSVASIRVAGEGGVTAVGNWTVSHYPHLYFAIKTLDSVSDLEFLVGFFRPDSALTYTTLPMGAASGITDFCGFIKTAGNANWQIHIRRGTAAGQAFNTGIPVATNTSYALEAKWVISYNSDLQFDPATGLFSVIGYQNEVWWYINGSLVFKLLAIDMGAFPVFQSNDGTVKAEPMVELISVKNKIGGAGTIKTIGCGLIYTEYFGSLPFADIGSLAFNTFPFNNEKLYAEIGV